MENISSLASDLTAEQEGTLSIATTHTQARYVLPEVIREFRERYPNVDLNLHQGTSEQIAELIGTNKVDFAIATGSQHLFSHLTLYPIYDWHRIVLVPKNHPLAQQTQPLDLETLADYPLVTYVFSLTGESSFKRAFRDRGLDPRVVFTARDADIIKTYVRMGMGVGVIASMAFECEDRNDLVALDARSLFPKVTTWLGFPRDMVLRSFMVDFIHLFAPQYSPRLIRDVANAETIEEANALLKDIKLPLRTGCELEEALRRDRAPPPTGAGLACRFARPGTDAGRGPRAARSTEAPPPGSSERRRQPPSTCADRCCSALSEFVTRHSFSALCSSFSARAVSPPGGSVSFASTSKRVKRLTPSTRSSVPTALQSSAVHSSFDALATARNDRIRQSTTAAVSSDSGDQRSPGPSNSAGASLSSAGSPSASSATRPSASARASTR